MHFTHFELPTGASPYSTLLNCYTQILQNLKVLYGFHQYVNKNVNIWCAANGITGCICSYLVNVTPNTINADDYFKM